MGSWWEDPKRTEGGGYAELTFWGELPGNTAFGVDLLTGAPFIGTTLPSAPSWVDMAIRIATDKIAMGPQFAIGERLLLQLQIQVPYATEKPSAALGILMLL